MNISGRFCVCLTVQQSGERSFGWGRPSPGICFRMLLTMAISHSPVNLESEIRSPHWNQFVASCANPFASFMRVPSGARRARPAKKCPKYYNLSQVIL